MGKITALKPSKHTGKRVNMYLDGKFALSIDTEVAVKEGLRIGEELSPDKIGILIKNISLTRCFNTAYRYLSYRPRSEMEMKKRLEHRGFESTQIEIVLNKLKENNLLNDTAFAQFWKENRSTFRPRSKSLTRVELKKKGVADLIIDEVTEQTDDLESAYHAALNKARRIPHDEYKVFFRRLSDHLKRRGFSYSIIVQTIKKVWQELTD